jgi:hypothetical protein
MQINPVGESGCGGGCTAAKCGRVRPSEREEKSMHVAEFAWGRRARPEGVCDGRLPDRLDVLHVLGFLNGTV